MCAGCHQYIDGIGFGLERLQMTIQGAPNLKRVGRSLTYLDGIRLNI